MALIALLHPLDVLPQPLYLSASEGALPELRRVIVIPGRLVNIVLA